MDVALFFLYLLFPGSVSEFDNDIVVSELSQLAIETATSQSNRESFELSDLIGQDFSLPENKTIEELTRWAVEKAYQIIVSNIVFDAFSYKNPKTNEMFHTVEEFLGNNTYVRGGTPTRYTSNSSKDTHKWLA